MHAVPNGWGSVTNVKNAPAGVIISFAVWSGRKGPHRGSWDVRCRNVRELLISDLDGGGIAVYGASHPAARQYGAPLATLRCHAGNDVDAVRGILLSCHLKEVDDWIPFDRYVGKLGPVVAIR